MEQQKNVALVLSGCGFKDGAEIHESVLTMLALDRAGLSYRCFAPDILQNSVVDHYHQKESNEKRNVLIESARIARGDIAPLKDFNVADFDALIFPGGFGVATSLSSFASDGPEFKIDGSVAKAVSGMHDAGKPIGALCIAPVLIGKIITGSKITIGDDLGVASALSDMGALHENTGIGGVVVDHQHKIITTPCYMLDSRISEISLGIENLVSELIKMI